MQVIKYPEAGLEWQSTIARHEELETVDNSVNSILVDIYQEGDDAVRRYTEAFDRISLESFEVTKEEIERAVDQVDEKLKQAIKTAFANIYAFHEVQKSTPGRIETMPGVECWQKSVPIEKVGLYVPGGSAPLFSTVLMLAIPPMIAGCREVILCTPCNDRGVVAPAILYAAALCGVTKIFKVGGAQAIGAMAFGTESIPRVYKIFGPGNRYVTRAKQTVAGWGNVAIDMPAGPSEVLVIGDRSCDARFVAADLLAQAEHGPDSQVLFVTDDERKLHEVEQEVKAQLELLPRAAIAAQALENSRMVLVRNMEEAMRLSNDYAPEHLIIQAENPEALAGQVTNAGSVFLGPYTPESAGDYASGTNHTLPTHGFARAYSGVSLDSFMKKITFQQITKAGLENIGPAIEVMAEAEQLMAHKQAVSIRLKTGEAS